MNLLFLSSWFPYPHDNGAKTRVYNLLHFLSQEYNVTLLTFASNHEDYSGLQFCSKIITVKENPFMKSRFYELFHFFLPQPIVTLRVKQMQDTMDAILSEDHYVCAIAFTSILGIYLDNRNISKILDVDAGLTSFALERFRLEKSRIGKLRAWVSLQKSINFEARMVSRFDAVIAPTKRSIESQSRIFKKAKRLEIIGNGVDLDYYPIMDLDRDPYTLLYSGSLTFSANYDAIQWFLREIYPIIKDAIPLVRLRITGMIEGVDLHDLSLDESVTFTGYLPDIRPIISTSWVCVVPIRIGGGQRMKILEAMALGTPVVSTSKGAEGLNVDTGINILIADEAINFANAVIQMLQDDLVRVSISKNAREIIETEYQWDSILSHLNPLIKSVSKT